MSLFGASHWLHKRGARFLERRLTKLIDWAQLESKPLLYEHYIIYHILFEGKIKIDMRLSCLENLFREYKLNLIRIFLVLSWFIKKER